LASEHDSVEILAKIQVDRDNSIIIVEGRFGKSFQNGSTVRDGGFLNLKKSPKTTDFFSIL
jgi:hypothetical protein